MKDKKFRQVRFGLVFFGKVEISEDMEPLISISMSLFGES